MSTDERALVFDCAGDEMLGVVTAPAAGATTTAIGVVVVVGGPQYRAGSHRQFVQLARALAADGHSVMRFDVRGMGDSAGAQRDFKTLDDDIAAAIDALQLHDPSLQRIVLWGLCDGASAALLYLQRRADPRVKALCLLNPWVRSEATLARAHVQHYYLRRLLQPAFWAKLIRGGVHWGAVSELAGKLVQTFRSADTAAAAGAQLPFQSAMAHALLGFDGAVLLLLSADDYTAKEFTIHAQSDRIWRQALAGPALQQVTLADADHTLSAASARQLAETAIRDWLHRVSVQTLRG